MMSLDLPKLHASERLFKRYKVRTDRFLKLSKSAFSRKYLSLAALALASASFNVAA